MFTQKLKTLFHRCSRTFRMTANYFDEEPSKALNSAWDDSLTRSSYCKPQMKTVDRNGMLIQIPTGLVDPSGLPNGDEYITFFFKLTYKHDLDVKALLNFFNDRAKRRNKLRQIVSDKMIQHLGLDLAVAHMVCNLGGRVKFIDMPEWFSRHIYKDSVLPKQYSGDLKLETIDLSGTNVVYEGFELLPQLEQLRHLRLRRCMHVDDFCLSRVGRIRSLELLDIGECPRLTDRGIATLAQLKNLRRLLIHNNPFMENKELVCLLLETHLPKLLIDGVNYLEALPEESRRKIYALIAADHKVGEDTNLLCSESVESSESNLDTEKSEWEDPKRDCA